MKFQLPAELPTDVESLNGLLSEAQSYLAWVVEQFDAGNTEGIDPGAIDQTLADIDTLSSAIAEASNDDADHQADVTSAVERARAAVTAAEGEDAGEGEDAEADAEPIEGELVGAGAPAAGAAGGGTPERRPVKFAGKGGALPDDAPKDGEPAAPAWVVSHGAPGFDDRFYGTKVGFSEMGKALDSCTKGRGVSRLAGVQSGPKFRQSVAKMSRGLKVIDNEKDLVDEINRATTYLPNGQKVTTESLVAAGGWCAPSEQIYTFCDVPQASDLISLPEIAIQRGGLRWPVEPDLTSLFESFEFFFTEPELEEVDQSGNPTAIKHCVEIPCPDEFEELRLNAVGYCVEAGILQRQGWPESIEYVLRALTQEHLRAMSRRTILDMWNGGGSPKIFDAHLQVGGTSSILNSLDLMATNLRLQKGYNRTYPIEIVAPSWLFAALRADMAMMEGIDTKFVTDGQILQWLSARNISGQFVGDWQTRSVGLPGHLDTLHWPGHVDIMMYPAGTWFRHLSNIIEVGVLYPKEQLQINRYTEFFTEDAIAVGKRCDRSVNLRVPLLINGGYGAPVEVSSPPDPDPLTVELTITGSPTGGNFKIKVTYADGSTLTTAAISHNANAAAIKSALVALDDKLTTDDWDVTGTGPFEIEYKSGLTLELVDVALTGGSDPDAELS